VSEDDQDEENGDVFVLRPYCHSMGVGYYLVFDA